MKLEKTVFIAFFALAVLTFAAPAKAESKWWIWGWGPGHWEQLNGFKPYIEHPTQTQNKQWDNDPWKPADWAKQRPGGGEEVVKGFYKADIIREQYTEDGLPAVRVGQGFYMLGGNDQRKVMAMLDYVYGITSNAVYGGFQIYDWNTRAQIGAYTQYGLYLK